ncbi:GNVR domain-containing protein [Anaerosinus sp.]
MDEDICSINVQNEVSYLQLGDINIKLKEKYFDFKEFNFEKTEKTEKISNELVKKQSHLLELGQTLLYKDSEVNSIKKEVETLNYKLNDEAKKAVYAKGKSIQPNILDLLQKKIFLEFSIEVNEVLLDTIDQMKKNKDKQFHNLSKDDQKYVELKRNVNNAEKVLSMLYTKCEIAKTQGQLNIQIIDPPNLPSDPIGSRKLLIIVIGVIIGGGFTIFLSIARDKHKKYSELKE